MTTYDTLDEAIASADSTEYGLQAAVRTESPDTAVNLARRLEAAGAMTHESSNFRVARMPFRRIMESGTGREGVRDAIEAFTRARLVLLSLEVPS